MWALGALSGRTRLSSECTRRRRPFQIQAAVLMLTLLTLVLTLVSRNAASLFLVASYSAISTQLSSHNPSSCSTPLYCLNGACNRSVVLFVLAHPDDEAMFFMPTLRAFQEGGAEVHLLSITTGGADGLGVQRTRELVAAADALSIRAAALNESAFADGFMSPWDVEAAATAISGHVRRSGVSFNTLVTFDAHGVSGHPNHRDTHRAVVLALGSHDLRGIEALQLRSVPIPFVAGLELLLLPLLLTTQGRQPSGRWLFWQHSCTPSWIGMQYHDSQWRSFRRVYVLLSRYSYLNELSPLTSLST